MRRTPSRLVITRRCLTGKPSGAAVWADSPTNNDVNASYRRLRTHGHDSGGGLAATSGVRCRWAAGVGVGLVHGSRVGAQHVAVHGDAPLVQRAHPVGRLGALVEADSAGVAVGGAADQRPAPRTSYTTAPRHMVHGSTLETSS